MKSNIHSWVAISLIPNLGPIKLAQLVEKRGSPETVLKQKTTLAVRKDLEQKANEILLRVEKLGEYAIFRDCPTYPTLLAQIPDAPPVLYAKGKLPDNLERAVVGTRECSEDGAAKASEIAKTLSDLSCPLISGLALGIDTAAHRASLAHGSPSVAVLAHGLDRIHPYSNRGLAQRLLENGGALLTEHPPGTHVLPWMFASRNRILVGLCVATIMVQSPIKGGSLISARLALDYNRDTFAVVPWNGFSSVWAGNTELILNTEAQKLNDISSLPDLLNFTVPPSLVSPSESEQQPISDTPKIPDRCKGVYDEIVLNAVMTLARLSRKLKQNIRAIRTRLFVLEMLGWVRRVPVDRYILP